MYMNFTWYELLHHGFVKKLEALLNLMLLNPDILIFFDFIFICQIPVNIRPQGLLVPAGTTCGHLLLPLICANFYE